jgi:hypothetical protein
MISLPAWLLPVSHFNCFLSPGNSQLSSFVWDSAISKIWDLTK